MPKPQAKYKQANSNELLNKVSGLFVTVLACKSTIQNIFSS